MSLTKKYALIGYPLGYSLSPALHNHFFKTNHLDAQYTSTPLTPDQIKTFIESKEFEGFNVTIPYKEIVFPLLDEITDAANKIGAINTVKKIDNKYIGTNTDYEGFLLMLKEEKGVNLYNKNVLLFGAGGAAKAIAYALFQKNIKSLFLYDIDINMSNTLSAKYPEKNITILNSTSDLSTILPQIDLLINSTPLGMEKTLDKSVLEKQQLALLPKSCLVVDIIYAPLQTKLLKMANELGLNTLNGLGMLAGQGIKGQEFWFGKRLSYQEAKNIMLKALQSTT